MSQTKVNASLINWTKGTDVASAATLSPAGDGMYYDVTGTTGITAVASGHGLLLLHFDAALTITHSANLVMPGGSDLDVAAGDEIILFEFAAGQYRCLSFQAALAEPPASLISLLEAEAGTETGTRSVSPLRLSQAIRYRAAPKNLIVNPGVRISQENGVASSTASGYYPVDQFYTAHLQDGTLTTQQVASATPGGSTHRIRTTVTAADASIASGQYALLVHPIEGLRVAELRWGSADAVDVVLRFGFKGPAGTYCVSIINQDNNRSYVREFTISGGEANTDTVQTLTFPGDTSGTWDVDNTLGMQIFISLATGSTYQTTPDAWQAGYYFGTATQSNGIENISDIFEFFDIGLYADPNNLGVTPAFELPHYEDDLLACKRYWEIISYHIETIGYATLGHNYFSTAYYKAEKRIVPSVTLTSLGYSQFGTGRYVTANYVDTITIYAAATATIASSSYYITEIVANSRM